MSRSRSDSEEDECLGGLSCKTFRATKKARFHGDGEGNVTLSDSDEDIIAEKAEEAKAARKKPWKIHRPRGNMHDANIYRYYRPDFRELARTYPDSFGVHVKEDPKTKRASIDWKNPEAMRELTRVMLRHDFDLEWDVPLDRLCPPVPNRLNYICWLADLMKPRSRPAVGDEGVDASRGAFPGGRAAEGAAACPVRSNGHNTACGEGDEAANAMACDDAEEAEGNPKRATGELEAPRCRGIDIGTGASCIYPLLGVKVAGWSFLATETDVVSAEWAGINVRSNGLQDQVTVRIVSPSNDANGPGPLLKALIDRDGDFDFCMTNPPFFCTEEEAGQNPNTATGGMVAAGEVACPGGEEAFVRSIIRDSLVLKQKVRWYTSMIGKKASAKRLLRFLREAGIKNTRTTEFFQGKVVRWGLAWSFSSEGMVRDKVPDDPSVKVFSKKKAAERTQHIFRSFSVPLRAPKGSEPHAELRTSASATAGHRDGKARSGGETTVKITLPENLPASAADIVERLKISLRCFKQAKVTMTSVGEYSSSAPASISNGSSNGSNVEMVDATTGSGNGHPTTGTGVLQSSTSTMELARLGPGVTTGVDGNGNDLCFRCVARARTSFAEADSGVGTGDHAAPNSTLFKFDIKVHGTGTSLTVSACLEEGSDRAMFHRVWDNLHQDVLRQNRRWRREVKHTDSSRTQSIE